MMRKATRRRLAAVEAEYGEPFWDVVKGFADEGESVTATAAILGLPRTTFRVLLARHGATGWFRPMAETAGFLSARASTRGKSSPARHRALAVARAANHTHHRIKLNGIEDTLTGHARRQGLSVHTVRGRIARGMTPIEALSPGKKSPPPRRNAANHPWRKGVDSRIGA